MKLNFSSTINIDLLQEVAVREYNGKKYYNTALIINKEGRTVKKKDGSTVKLKNGSELLDYGVVYKKDESGGKSYIGNINYVKQYEAESSFVMFAIDQTQPNLDVVTNNAYKGEKGLRSTYYFNIEFDHSVQKNDIVGKIVIKSKDGNYLEVGAVKFLQAESKAVEEEVVIPSQDNEDDLPF